jgi:hypothetical protein
MMKFEISGAARLALLCLGVSAWTPARADTTEVDLPGVKIMGKRPDSRFQRIRDRSKGVLEYQVGRKWRDPNLIASFVDETTIPGAQIWMYPAGSGYPLPAMTDGKAYDGKASLEVVLKADAYSGGAVCSPAPIDITPYLDKGMLELYVTGAQGDEVFSIGVLDNGNNPVGRPLQSWVSSRSFSKVLKGEWKRIRVPLKAFGPLGSYWSEEINARVVSQLNRTSISCFSLDIDKERHKSFRIWLDDVKLFRVAPAGAVVGGSGYPISNEDFDDFAGPRPPAPHKEGMK